MAQINPYEVYTTAEAEVLLKISNSTVKRLLKKGLLRANKIGKNYRILGHDLLQMLSYSVDEKATIHYQKIKSSIRNKLEDIE